ncbi:MAG: ribonuclease [Lachnospiraceae bacterium]|nr:ribonuclease [Lachnospiraceae bacterium]
MKKLLRTLLVAFAALCMTLLMTACDEATTEQILDFVVDEFLMESESSETASIEYGESYTTAVDVSLYLHTYEELPPNFITKKEAQKLGWTGGSLEMYAPGKCIGGDYFGNYEELLPEKEDRTYRECDIDTLGKDSRGAKRIVYSDDGLIYYTEDHYESFTLLYGNE